MTEDQRTIVVGVDGSAAGDGALRWAVREAARQHDRVHAIHVRDREDLLPATSLAFQPHGRMPTTDVGTLREQLRAAVRSAVANVPEPPEIMESVRTGHPATELIAESADADLLVVGSQGHRPLADLLLGSVAAQCVRHAHCPVVIAPVAVAATG
jgi:nucleotide-binding universal stress UspA family protein